MAAAGNRLVWTDTETTGTVGRDCHLLEVACFVTDTDLNVLSEEPFHAVIGYSREQAQNLYLEAQPLVREMHDRTGLWDRIVDGTPLAQVEQDLYAFITRHCPDKEQGHLAGNSVHLDADFIKEHLPSVADHLHYRLVDVSSLALLARWSFGVDVRKASDHTALTDIMESLQQLRVLWGPIVEAVDARGTQFERATPGALAVAR